MEKFVADNWGVITTILAFVFNTGIIYKGLKDKPGRSEVYRIATEKIKEHKEGCDYYKKTDGVKLQQSVEDLKDTVDKIDGRIEKMYGKIMQENKK
jgi:hypothetical protein